MDPTTKEALLLGLEYRVEELAAKLNLSLTQMLDLLAKRAQARYRQEIVMES